jgi:hypothetical protein
MSTPHLSDDSPKRRTKQTLQAPRQVGVRTNTAKKKSLSWDKIMKKLVWVTVGKTEHQAWLLEDLGEQESVAIQWESTGGQERVSVLKIRLEMPSRRSRQRNAQITDMKKLLKPPTPKELQDAEVAKKKKQLQIRSAPTARKAKRGSKSSGESKSKKRKRRQKCSAPKSYADAESSESEFELDKSRSAVIYAETSESEFEFTFNQDAAAPGESSNEGKIGLDVNEMDRAVLPRRRSKIPSSERPVTRKRLQIPSRELLLDVDDSDLLDSDGNLLSDNDERPDNSDDDEDPEIIKKSKYIKRISLTPRSGLGYYAEIIDSYHFPKFKSRTLPKPQLAPAALPVNVSLSRVDSSDDEAEIHRTLQRVKKRKLSNSFETSNKNSVCGFGSNASGKAMEKSKLPKANLDSGDLGTKADGKVEIEGDPPANELSVGSGASKTAGVPASSKSVEKKVQESIVEISIASVSSIPNLVSDMQTGIVNNKTTVSGYLPIAKRKISSEKAELNSVIPGEREIAVAARAKEKVVSKRMVDASTANPILGSIEEARPEKAVISQKPAEGIFKKVVPKPSVPEKLFLSGFAEKPTTSAKVLQKPSVSSDSESEGFDSSDDENVRIKQAHARIEVAKKKKNPFSPAQSHKSKAAEREQDGMRPLHKTATNDTDNQGLVIQEAAKKRVSASTVETASDDNTDLQKKSVVSRPTTGLWSGLWFAKDRNSSDVKMEIERNKSQSSVVKKVAASSSVAKAGSSVDDIDSSDDEAELRRTRSAGASASSNILSSIHKRASSDEKETENRASPAKLTGMLDSYDANSSDDEAEIRRTKERAKLPVGAGFSSNNESELRRTKRRSSDPNRKKSVGRKSGRRLPLYAKRRATSSTIDAESPFRKTPAFRITEDNCIPFSRGGAQDLKLLLVKDFADRVVTWAVESSRETIVAGSATIQELPDTSFKFVAESSLDF